MCTTQNFEIVSDFAMFGAREWVHEHMHDIRLFGHHHHSEPAEELDPALLEPVRQLNGRSHFYMHPTKLVQGKGTNVWDDEYDKDRSYAVLRVDYDNGVISGDLFKDMARRDWKLSWRSEAVFVTTPPTPDFDEETWKADGWNIFAIADVVESNPSHRSEDISQKVAIAIKATGEETFTAMRLAFLNQAGHVVQDLSFSDHEPAWFQETFRYLKIINVVDPKFDQGPASPIWPSIFGDVLGTNGNAIRQSLFDLETGLYLKEEDFTTETGAGDSPIEMLAPYQWTDDPYIYSVLFSADDENPGLYGEVPGLDGETPLHRARFGAVIYPNSIAKTVASGAKGRDLKKHQAEIITRIQRTYVHELGHLLNLPHVWQRDLFAHDHDHADPSAISIMNYGSQYPLGNFMATSRNWVLKNTRRGSSVEELRLKDNQNSLKKGLGSAGFNLAEQKRLWHIPFNQIASGGDYFTRPKDKAPVIQEQTVWTYNDGPPRTPFELKLFDPIGEEEGVLEFGRYSDGYVTHQPIFGEVIFTAEKERLEDRVVHFTFQCPMLSLIVRADRHQDPAGNYIGETRVAPVPGMPFDVRFCHPADEACETDPMHLAKVLQSASIKPVESPAEDMLIFRRRLPLVMGNFFESFRPSSYEFTLQVVLTQINGETIYSNPKRIRFKSAVSDYPELLKPVLQNPRFPLLVELLSYRIDRDLGDLRTLNPHDVSKHDQRILYDLVEILKRDDLLKDVKTSQELFEYCNDLLRVEDELDSDNKGLLPFQTDLGIIRQFLSTNDDLLKKIETRNPTQMEEL